jgi:hypothetical protein
MEIIGSIQELKMIKISVDKSVANRLQILRDETKKNKMIFNFDDMMELQAIKLITKAEKALKELI